MRCIRYRASTTDLVSMGLADMLFAAKVHCLDRFVSKQEGVSCCLSTYRSIFLMNKFHCGKDGGLHLKKSCCLGASTHTWRASSKGTLLSRNLNPYLMSDRDQYRFLVDYIIYTWDIYMHERWKHIGISLQIERCKQTTIWNVEIASFRAVRCLQNAKIASPSQQIIAQKGVNSNVNTQRQRLQPKNNRYICLQSTWIFFLLFSFQFHVKAAIFPSMQV